MATLTYTRSEQIPVTHDMDVLVVGGGPGGIGAAVMAARAGARVLLVERYGFPGGMATAGEVHPFMLNHVHGVCLDKPVYVDWVKAMQAYRLPAERPAPERLEEVPTGGTRAIVKEAAMLAAEDLCLEAGVDLLYHHTLADVEMDDDGRIEALVFFSKSGFSAIRGRVVIDCTGDGDVAAWAEAPFEQGGPTGACQPMTLCFKLGAVDCARMPTRTEISARYEAARQRGELSCPREDVLYFPWVEEGVVHFNTTRILKRSATVGAELSVAEIEARQQVREFLHFFRREVPGFEKCRLYSMAHQIGIRESRRVRGQAYLTREDFERCARFPDAVSRVHYPIDIHNPEGGGTTHFRLPDNEWYEIPYGCIVPLEVRNLLVGGRPISVDHAVHSSMRVMPPACSVGQAAGMAAALCVERNAAPADLDGREVRRRLADAGAFL